MKLAGLFLLAVLLLPGGDGPQFEITDARGKKASGVSVEAGEPDADGWFSIKLLKTKGEPVIVWPSDSAAKLPDGPAPIPVIAIQRGDEKALANPRVVAAIATPVALGLTTMDETARRTGFEVASLHKAFSALPSAADPFAQGVGLSISNRAAGAAEALALALKERQRQLTRVPSEIYPVALLYGQALDRAGKFDAAAVAFLTALNQRPSDEAARKLRAAALIHAGKPEAANQ